MPAPSTLTDLEALVLGVVRGAGPVTSYAVAQEFAASVTSHWSGSVGAIYPAMRRLEKRGLVAATDSHRGRRPQRTYTLTRAGRAVLRAWVRAPLPEGVGGATEDPIRSRFFSLPLLRPDERVAWVARAIDRVRAELTRVDEVIAEHTEAGDDLSVLGLEGARHELDARLAWLRSVKRRVGGLPARGGS